MWVLVVVIGIELNESEYEWIEKNDVDLCVNVLN